MNTKGMKFLAVLAVLAMAFVCVSAIGPSDASGTEYEAQIGDTKYTTLDLAMAAAVDGDEIVLLKDASITSHDTTVTSGITINGKNDTATNYTLTVAASQRYGGEMTIKNVEMAMANPSWAIIYTTDYVDERDAYLTLENVTFAESVNNATIYVQHCTNNTATFVAKNVDFTNATVTLDDVDGTAGHHTFMEFQNCSNLSFKEVFAPSTDGKIVIGKDIVLTDTEIDSLVLKTNNDAVLEIAQDAVINGVTLEANTSIVIDGDSTLTMKGEGTKKLDICGATVTALALNGITLKGGEEFDGSISYTDSGNKTNSMSGKFTANGDVTVTPGSLSINGNLIDSDGVYSGLSVTVSGDSIKISGTATDIDIIIDEGTNVTLAGSLTLAGKSTLTVGSDSELDVGDNTLTINQTATMIVEGTVTTETGTIENNGTIEVGEDADISDADIEGEGKIVPEGEEEFGIEGTLDSDYTITTSAYLAGDLVIPEGITLTVNGTLKMLSKDIYVYGDLVVGKKGVITTSTSDAVILLAKTGEITNDGVIGSGSEATIAMYDANGYGTVKIEDVSGIQFESTKVVSGTVSYYLTISGDVSKVKGSVAYVLIADEVYIDDLNIKDLDNTIPLAPVLITDSFLTKDATLTIGTKADVDLSGLGMFSGSSLVINGAVSTLAGNIHLLNNASVVVNGDASLATFEAKTGPYKTYAEEVRQDPEIALTTTTSIDIENLKGLTLYVSSKTYLDDYDESWTEQMFNIYGEASVVTKDDDAGIEISGVEVSYKGKVYVPAGMILTLPELSPLAILAPIVTSDDSVIVAQGLISTYDEIDCYSGAAYAIEYEDSTGAAYDMYYYTTFDNAYEFLGTCVDNTIVLQGGYEFNGIYTIGADQFIYFLDGEDYVITTDAVVSVLEDGTIEVASLEGIGFTKIEGILYVELGGDCIPDATAYSVSSKDDEGNMTYTGLAKALADSEVGDVISLKNTTDVNTLLTVPFGVTLKVETEVVLDAMKGLTVNGILVNKGTVNVSGGNLVVAGEFDNTEGTTKSTGTDYAMTVTGVFVGNVPTVDGAINAAGFINSDNDQVYTSVALATITVALMDVPADITVTGTVTEASDIVLVKDMKLFIAGTVKLASIELEAGSKVLMKDASAKLTTVAVGASGGPLEIPAKVTVTGLTVTGTDVTIFEDKYSEKDNKYTFNLAAYDGGTVSVDAGIVNYIGTGALDVKETRVFNVASGANVIVDSNITIKGTSTYFGMSGTMTLKNGGTIEGLTIAGTLHVPKTMTVTLDGVTVTGSVIGEVTSTESGKIVVKTSLVIGKAPTSLGADATVTGNVDVGEAYVLAYGTSVFTTTAEGVVNTAFTINGSLYATVYGADTTTLAGALDKINTAVPGLSKAGYDVPVDAAKKYNGGWKSGSSTVSGTTKIGAYATATATLSYKAVSLTYSVEPGITLYIDGLAVEGTTGKLTVGTHTIKTYLKPDYQGDIIVKLNGTTLPVTASGIVLDVTVAMLSTTNVLSVTGAEPIPEPEPTPTPTPEEKSEWTVTTILLCVLVVLIAIMAVIVALRLNRN